MMMHERRCIMGLEKIMRLSSVPMVGLIDMEVAIRVDGAPMRCIGCLLEVGRGLDGEAVMIGAALVVICPMRQGWNCAEVGITLHLQFLPQLDYQLVFSIVVMLHSYCVCLQRYLLVPEAAVVFLDVFLVLRHELINKGRLPPERETAVWFFAVQLFRKIPLLLLRIVLAESILLLVDGRVISDDLGFLSCEVQLVCLKLHQDAVPHDQVLLFGFGLLDLGREAQPHSEFLSFLLVHVRDTPEAEGIVSALDSHYNQAIIIGTAWRTNRRGCTGKNGRRGTSSGRRNRFARK